MRTLSDAVAYINEKYPQSWVEQNDVDLLTGQKIRRKYPRYLFRGEEDSSWKTTLSSYSRQKNRLDPILDEYKYWISGRHPVPDFDHHYSLYFVLRDARWKISAFDKSQEASKFDEQIAAILQHYGFPTSMIDLTSEPLVAAHFALGPKLPGQVGRIMVLPSANLEYRLFDLSFDPQSRPDRQKGFALVLPPELDLKSVDFTAAHGCCWIPFQMTDQDVQTFFQPDVLSTDGDIIVQHILDWYDAHIPRNTSASPELVSFIAEKVERLSSIR